MSFIEGTAAVNVEEMMSRPLNVKQLAFVKLYIATGNATQAYVKAGYSARGHAAGACAAKLLTRADIQQLLKPAQQSAELERKDLVNGITIDRDRIRLELARLSFVDPRRLFGEDGRLKAVKDLDADSAAALAQFEVTERDDEGVTVRVTKVKLWDKNRALQSLADTEPGVWSEDAKDRPGDTNVSVSVEQRVNALTLTPEDLRAAEVLLARAFAGAADRETPPPAIEEHKP